MSESRRVLLIDADPGVQALGPLAQALRDAGAQVRQIHLEGQYGAVLDAIAQGWLPVVRKTPAAGSGAAGIQEAPPR